MKRVYERPAMTAEIFETNAYCNGCGTTIKTGELILNSNSTFNRTNNGGNDWVDAGGYEKSELYHTFTNDSIYQTVSGNCMGGRNNKCRDDSQSIWRCVCHPEDAWYLEWSHNYTHHFNNGKDTFFLYHETTGNNSFNIASSQGPWPYQNRGNDDCVAQVVFSEGTSVVANS